MGAGAETCIQQPRSQDRGFSLVEIVVAIAILGIAATSILAALVSGIGGSSRHREHANMTAWLQSAADHLEYTPMRACGSGTASDVATAYKEEIQDEDNVENSDGWNPTLLTVTAVQFWDGSAFSSTCSGGNQLISLSVTSPSHDITQTLDVVKGQPYVELSDPANGSDPFAGCNQGTITFTASKTGAVISNSPKTLKLKKPSATKPSKLVDDHIRVTVAVTGNCPGKLRLYYQWPHYDNKGNLKHYHTRRINLKLVKGGDGLTYTGKVGHHGDKWLDNTTINWYLQIGRTKQKTWAQVGNAIPVTYT
jgi:prepilin-type N-terminal cleavage/methylation domain-containing protein